MSNGAPFELSTVEEAVAAVRAGEIVVVVDDMDRENEGDRKPAWGWCGTWWLWADGIVVFVVVLLVIMAGSLCSSEKMAWIIRHSSCAKSQLAPTTLNFLAYLGCVWVQWLHLHLPSRRAPGWARDSDDGSPQPGEAQDCLHRHLRRRRWSVCSTHAQLGSARASGSRPSAGLAADPAASSVRA